MSADIDMLRRAQVATIIAASGAVHDTFPKITATRTEVDRLERELATAREKYEAAIAERDAKTEKVHEYVRQYGQIEHDATPTERADDGAGS